MKALIPLFLCLALGTITNVKAQQNVVVNGQALAAQTVQQLEAYYKVKIQPGRYWYDSYCGLWGKEGGPAQGGMMAGLALGGQMWPGVSRGQTRIFINGRQIPQSERVQWEQLTGSIQPGRYWLDAYGNVGLEGGPALGNLIALAQQSYSGNNRGNRNSFYRNFYTGTGSGSSSEGFYIMGDGWSYSSF